MHYYWPREPQGRELENLTQLFKVLGDPSRMKVLFQIGSSEACVTEVAARLNMSESAVSSPYPLIKSVSGCFYICVIRQICPLEIGRASCRERV